MCLNISLPVKDFLNIFTGHWEGTPKTIWLPRATGHHLLARYFRFVLTKRILVLELWMVSNRFFSRSWILTKAKITFDEGNFRAKEWHVLIYIFINFVKNSWEKCKGKSQSCHVVIYAIKIHVNLYVKKLIFFFALENINFQKIMAQNIHIYVQLTPSKRTPLQDGHLPKTDTAFGPSRLYIILP